MANLEIDLANLLAAAEGNSEITEINDKIPSSDPENVKIVDKIRGKITFIKIETGLIGDFDLKLKIELKCARCLKKVILPLHLKYQQEFASKSENNPSQDIQYTIIGQKVDILPSIQQEILLNVPIKPLCKNQCKIINYPITK